MIIMIPPSDGHSGPPTMIVIITLPPDDQGDSPSDDQGGQEEGAPSLFCGRLPSCTKLALRVHNGPSCVNG